jgi:flagellin
MSVVNTNIKALIAQQSSVKVGRDMATAMERLSTGLKVNKAADDAAGLAIGSHMTAQIRGLNMAVKNSNDAVAMLQTAEGSMVEMTNILQRMRELGVQAANDTNTSEDRQYLNNEFQSLKSEFNRIVKNTQWNGMNLLDGTFRANDYAGGLEAVSGGDTSVSGLFKFQVGANAGQMIQHTFGDYHNSSAVKQSGTITFLANPELADSVSSSTAVGLSGAVIRITINDTIISYTTTSAAETPTVVAAALSSLINSSAELSTLISASADTGVLTITSAVAGSAFTVSTDLTQDESILNYDETTANATRGWEVLQDLMITNADESTHSIETLDHAIVTINQGRADIGATINRLTSAIDNMTTTSTNLSDSRSRIMDADYAVESTKLARSQIVSQAATAMLAQANAQQQSVLALLQ